MSPNITKRRSIIWVFILSTANGEITVNKTKIKKVKISLSFFTSNKFHLKYFLLRQLITIKNMPK